MSLSISQKYFIDPMDKLAELCVPDFACHLIVKAHDLLERVTGPCAATALPTISGIAAGVFAAYVLYSSPLDAMDLSVAGRVCLLFGAFYISIASYARISKTIFVARLEGIINNSQSNNRTALLIDSSEMNGMDNRITLSIFSKLAKEYKIERRVINNREEFRHLCNEEKEYELYCFRAHGRFDGFALGDFFLHKDMPNAIKNFSKKVPPGAKVIFASCNAAQGEENFAKTFSSANSSATIYASSHIVNSFWGIRVSEIGIPQFRSLLGFDATMIYENGKAVDK